MKRDKLDVVRDKLLHQAKLIMKKVKPKKDRELTNADVELALYQYSIADKNARNEYGENELEWLHQRLTSLTEEEMAVITKRYWEAKSYEVIGNELGHIGDPKWAFRKLEVIMVKFRAKA